MKRYALLTFLILLFALPAFAQADITTYILDSGTSIDYPSGWDAEQSDNLVILSRRDISRAVIIDHPVVSELTIDVEPSLMAAVAVVANEVLSGDYDADLITTFDVAGRDAARYDLEGGSDNIPGSIVAVRFSNDRIGMIIAINVSEGTLIRMLESFDNTQAANNAAPLPSQRQSAPLASPDAHIFRAAGRITIPAGWSVDRNLLNNAIEYLTLTTADSSTTALAFDLSRRCDRWYGFGYRTGGYGNRFATGLQHLRQWRRVCPRD